MPEESIFVHLMSRIIFNFSEPSQSVKETIKLPEVFVVRLQGRVSVE